MSLMHPNVKAEKWYAPRMLVILFNLTLELVLKTQVGLVRYLQTKPNSYCCMCENSEHTLHNM